MTKLIEKKYLVLCFALACLFIYLSKIGGYIIVDFLHESKYASAVFEMHGLKALFLPYLDGNICEGGGIAYYLLVKICSFVFASLNEFTLRIPSVIFAFMTIIMSYYFAKRMVNKTFAVILCLSLFASSAFVIYSSVSSPQMLSACAVVIAVLSGIITSFIERVENKKYYYFLFWIFSLLAGLLGNFSSVLLPLIIVFPILAKDNKTTEFLAPRNFLPGFLTDITLIVAYLFLGYHFFSSDFIYFINRSSAPIVISLPFAAYLHCLKKALVYFVCAAMPWTIYIVVFLFDVFINFCKKLRNKNNDFYEGKFEEGKKFFEIFIWATLCSAAYFLIWHTDDVSTMLPLLFFLFFLMAYYWYINIFEEAHKKTIYIPSLLFYVALIVLMTCVTVAFFIATPIQKVYVEPLVVPVMSITLMVSIIGLIAIALKRRLLNFSMHIVFSVLLFFFTTGMLYNYISSFGENDLINFAIKARQNDAVLVTYNIKNKYSMIFYYKAPIVFNGEMNAEDIFNNYGDSRNVYVVVKLTDLEFFDKYFVYEIIASGKQYCEISNIKYLPKDEIDANAEADTQE